MDGGGGDGMSVLLAARVKQVQTNADASDILMLKPKKVYV